MQEMTLSLWSLSPKSPSREQSLLAGQSIRTKVLGTGWPRPLAAIITLSQRSRNPQTPVRATKITPHKSRSFYDVLDPVQSVIFGSSNLQKSIDYWHGTLGLQLHSKDDKSAVISFGEKQAKLVFQEIGKMILIFYFVL